MPDPMDAPAVLEREFLEIRAKILEIAASFDRLQRGPGSVQGDPRMDRIQHALRLLLEDCDDRAEQVQLTFSRSYDDDWQQQYGLSPR